MIRASAVVLIMICPRSSPLCAVGPFEVYSPGDATVLRLQLASQLQAVWESKDKGNAERRETTLYMRARRIRPMLTLSVPDYRTEFRLHLSLAPGSLELMDIYFDSRLSSQVRLRIGQYKIPFTRYRIQSFQRLTFVDWALVTRYFGAERQFGISVHNGYEKPPSRGYVIGVYSGVNARSSHAIGLASVFGEKPVNRSDLSGSAKTAEFHPEIACHFSYNANEIDVSTDSDAEGGGFRYSLSSSVAWDLEPAQYEDLALRAAQEFLMKFRHVSVMGAGYIGLMETNASLRTRKAMIGFLVQTACRVGKRCEFSLRYAVADIDDHVADAALSRAQTIIAGTADETVISQYENAGLILQERECTLGFNLYLDGHNLKFQDDIGFSRQLRRLDKRTDFLFRSQLQLSF